jgi:hypothetical protein
VAEEPRKTDLELDVEEYDSDHLLPGRASVLAKHRGPLRLTCLEEIEPQIAKILVTHRGGQLSLPAVRLLSPEVAEILAGYEGRLSLDGLWLLDSLPLAKKLASQWKTQGVTAAYPNLSIEVAENLDLWPPESPRWPPGKTSEEGAKLPIHWAFTSDESTSGLSTEEKQAIEMWRAYSRRRDALVRDVLDSVKQECGLDLTVIEMSGTPSMLSSLAMAEKRFRTSWWITEVAEQPTQGLFYLSDNGIVGPVSWEDMEAATAKELAYYYWDTEKVRRRPRADIFTEMREDWASVSESSGLRWSDMQVGPRDGEKDLRTGHEAAKACLIAAENVAKIVRELVWASSFDTLSRKEEIDSFFDWFERLDDLTEMACFLAPELKALGTIEKLKGRAWGTHQLGEWLHEFRFDCTEDWKRHVRSAINRLSKRPSHGRS